jgi:hypothetical protein
VKGGRGECRVITYCRYRSVHVHLMDIFGDYLSIVRLLSSAIGRMRERRRASKCRDAEFVTEKGKHDASNASYNSLDQIGDPRKPVNDRWYSEWRCQSLMARQQAARRGGRRIQVS